MCIVHTNDGRIIRTEIPVPVSTADDERTGNSFLLNDDQQFEGPDKVWYQVVTEKSKYPMALYDENKPEYADGKNNDDNEKTLLTKQLIIQAFKNKIAQKYNEMKRNAQLEAFKWIATIAFSALCIIGVVYKFVK